MSDTVAFGIPAEERKGYQLTETERVNVVVELAHRTAAGVLPRGSIQAISVQLRVSRTAVTAIWTRLLSGEQPGKVVKSRKNKNQNASKYDKEELMERVRALPSGQKKNLRDIAHLIF